MNKRESDKLKEDQADDMGKLLAYHAREVTAIRTAHSHVLNNFKERSAREASRLKEEIIRLKDESHRLKRVVTSLEKVITELRAKRNSAPPRNGARRGK